MTDRVLVGFKLAQGLEFPRRQRQRERRAGLGSTVVPLETLGGFQTGEPLDSRRRKKKKRENRERER